MRSVRGRGLRRCHRRSSFATRRLSSADKAASSETSRHSSAGHSWCTGRCPRTRRCRWVLARPWWRRLLSWVGRLYPLGAGLVGASHNPDGPPLQGASLRCAAWRGRTTRLASGSFTGAASARIRSTAKPRCCPGKSAAPASTVMGGVERVVERVLPPPPMTPVTASCGVFFAVSEYGGGRDGFATRVTPGGVAPQTGALYRTEDVSGAVALVTPV